VTCVECGLRPKKGTNQMRTILLAAAAALVFSATASAGADQLPAIYFGKWCELTGEFSDGGFWREQPGEICDGPTIVVTPGRIDWTEERCSFRSIKRTNDLRPNHTKATKADYTPVMEVVIQCFGDDSYPRGGVRRLWLTYQKGTLSIDRTKP
jgi:hypothetical protein